MPYVKVGQESSGPIGLYYRTIGQGATDREALIRVRRASDGWSAEGRQSAPQVCTESVSRMLVAEASSHVFHLSAEPAGVFRR